MKLEFESSLDTKQFYKKIWVPFCKAKSIRLSKNYWCFSDEIISFEQWIEELSTYDKGREYLLLYK
jgi:hypothetical protein